MTALKKNRKYQSISQLLRLNIVSGKFSFRPTHMIMYTRQTVKYFLLWIMVPKVSKPSLLWLALLWTEMSLQLFPFLFGYISQPSEQCLLALLEPQCLSVWFQWHFPFFPRTLEKYIKTTSEEPGSIRAKDLSSTRHFSLSGPTTESPPCVPFSAKQLSSRYLNSPVSYFPW